MEELTRLEIDKLIAVLGVYNTFNMNEKEEIRQLTFKLKRMRQYAKN